MMQAGLYVTLSGQLAIDRRMATIANNIANLGTVGYRADELKFDTILSRVSHQPTAFATSGASFVSERAGGINKTGNPLDVAITGQGWLAIQTPQGTAYTRDGRMQVSSEGQLQTLNGYAVLDTGLAPIEVDARGGAIQIARDGTIRQGGRQSGGLGLFELDLAQGYSRFENSAVIPSQPGAPIQSFVDNGVMQGFVEEANVSPVLEMTRLIAVTRSFDGLQTAISESESSFKRAIQTLGGA
jgi:flagellar basal-body rod protein FlgF